MAILRGLKDQLLKDRRLRCGEASIVDAEGVMVDGNEEIEDYYAGIIANSATALPQQPARSKKATQDTSDCAFLTRQFLRDWPPSPLKATS